METQWSLLQMLKQEKTQKTQSGTQKRLDYSKGKREIIKLRIEIGVKIHYVRPRVDDSTGSRSIYRRD